MNLLELALESTEKYGWCTGSLEEGDGTACVEGHILRAHGHEEPWYGLFDSSENGCSECRKALLALHAAGASAGSSRSPVDCVWKWNDTLEMPRDEALYRDTLLRGAKLLDEVEA